MQLKGLYTHISNINGNIHKARTLRGGGGGGTAKTYIKIQFYREGVGGGGGGNSNFDCAYFMDGPQLMNLSNL